MGLSTLNSMAFGLAVYASPRSLPSPTQDSLPAAGQALPDGTFAREVPTKGFKVVLLHLILLSQALLGAMFTSERRKGRWLSCIGLIDRKQFAGPSALRRGRPFLGELVPAK
jgi:hypothetical protein